MDPKKLVSRCSSVDIFPSPEDKMSTFPKARGVIWDVSDDFLEVLEPCDHKGNPIFFNEGEEVLLSFAVDKKRAGFKSKVLKISDSPRLVRFSLSSKFEICDMRSSVRIPVHLCATFRYPTEDSEALLGGVVGDLTEKGCFATVAGILPLDLPIICTFYIDGGKISTLGKAVRMVPTDVPGFNGYGIMFDTLSPEASEKIEQVMREKIPELKEVCRLVDNDEIAKDD